MFSFDCISKENMKELNPKCPEVPAHKYRISILGGSGSRKTNALLNLINNEPGFEFIYMRKIHLRQNINY